MMFREVCLDFDAGVFADVFVEELTSSDERGLRRVLGIFHSWGATLGATSGLFLEKWGNLRAW